MFRKKVSIPLAFHGRKESEGGLQLMSFLKLSRKDKQFVVPNVPNKAFLLHAPKSGEQPTLVLAYNCLNWLYQLVTACCKAYMYIPKSVSSFACRKRRKTLNTKIEAKLKKKQALITAKIDTLCLGTPLPLTWDSLYLGTPSLLVSNKNINQTIKQETKHAH